ncbi:NAD(P)-dependent dehydrogenase (short-subunit alcohol dehydrogenase family) [Tepidamorphus gemmatus]|uniref:NAD(P)-dependent dehydrogenase (Short-subunit alcohol dehydrogenase family) n=1 Tax=Tepidamorphus gemmatus TaxID=747076 RepID=A0A4R3ML35_9HYPH|nr:3-oxoacyl-ACP reductase family protein [Tepidamorphus gemmatus]TCT12580.1 NAD(P)-dependent dehydrogenase (short-subunit alcohol dehydrogenase family) [Tepidamorphus gemmatus]
MRLEGKVAVVTGAGQGIGRAIAARLAEEGARVAIVDMREAGEAAEAIGRGAVGIACDVSSEADVAAMASRVEAGFGGADILVNNAGIYSSLIPQPFEAIDIGEWRRVMDVNVLGAFLCCRAIVPMMRRRGGGRIVNINSGTPFKGVPFLLHYVTSKGAIIGFTRALARELGGAGILVNAVAPGFTLSDGVKANPVQMEKLQEVSLKARVIPRDQHPEDVVGAVAFLVGPDAAFITGQTLVVDGGAYFH